MEIILIKPVPRLGQANEIVQANSGYANNHLIPNGLAMISNNTNRKIWEENKQQAVHKAARIKEQAKEQGRKLKRALITLLVKIGKGGQFFGNITRPQIAKAISNAMDEFTVSAHQITIKSQEEIKALGHHPIEVQLHKEVTVPISIYIKDEAS